MPTGTELCLLLISFIVELRGSLIVLRTVDAFRAQWKHIKELPREDVEESSHISPSLSKGGGGGILVL